MSAAVIPVDEVSRVGEVRRAALDLARAEGLDESLSANLALVSTEICTNLLKHARGGEVFLTSLSDRNASGVEILAIDRGPGMADLAKCLADGYSSGVSPGTGLGAVTRLSQEFDVYTERDKGTVLVSRVRSGVPAPTPVGGIVKPVAGETLSGDAWAVVERDGALALIVADGLGHGVDAARASAVAISAFRSATDLTPANLLKQVHGALRGTRGAAVAVAYIDLFGRRLRYSGIGNIAGVISHAGKPVFMVSHSGTAGYDSPRFQEFSYPLPDEALVIMHSDGMHTSWRLDSYPGLRRSHPSVIAGVLYRDATRVRDDVSVVVVKTGGAR